MKKLLPVFLIALISVLIGASAVQASDVTITALPAAVSFNSSPSTWTLNGITGSGLIDEDTKYYANPLGDTTPPSATVADADCYFTWNNTSSVNITVTVNCGNFTGGDADMTNSNTGGNGATTFGGYSWVSGQPYADDKQIIKWSASTAVYNTTSAGEDKKWGAEILTRTNEWSGTDGSTATLTITAAAL